MFSTGVSETVVLNMSTLTWSVVTSVQGRIPVASEVIIHHGGILNNELLLKVLTMEEK